MKTRTVSTSMVLDLLLISTAGVPATAARGGSSAPEFIPLEVTMLETESGTFQATVHTSMHQEDLPDTNFSKLRIIPRSDWMEMMPGDSEEITVTVKNIDNRTVSIDLETTISPYGEYVFDECRIAVGPIIAELEPDSEEDFSFMVEIPGDAECGHYSMQVVFTEVEPTPYPAPLPHYKNAFGLLIEVWKPLAIRVLPSHIHDRVESDQGYDYQAYIENVGEEDIGIDPEMSDDGRYYELYGTFRSDSSHEKDPFFDVALAGPNEDTAFNLAGIVIHGSVNLGNSGCIPPPPGLVWETGGGHVYNEGRGEYREHYMAATCSSIGDWELEIVPYVEEFEYARAIAIGEAGLNSE